MIATGLLIALIAVESGGNPNAIGDYGQAHGALQIHREVVVDVNRFFHRHYRLSDAYSIEDAKEICRLYLSHYATEELLGHAPTDSDRARIWNGGPTGTTKEATKEYWQRVRANIPAQDEAAIPVVKTIRPMFNLDKPAPMFRVKK